MDTRTEAPTGDLVLHRPSAPARQLVLLFHGVGASPEGFEPLGPALARDDRWVVAVRSPFESGFGAGWQWFSLQGVTETNRAERIAAAMPGLRGFVGVDLVRHARLGWVPIEVNARVSCAWVGLSAVLGRPLAGEVLALHRRARAQEPSDAAA